MTPTDIALTRRLPVGSEPLPDGGAHFRVWAPQRRSVEVVLGADGAVAFPLEREPDGYFSGLVADVRPGTLYRYRLDGGDAFPDPASRFQPDGPHGPSQVVDPTAFRWTDRDWCGLRLPGQVIYEMHIGTFTREGTYRAAMEQFAELRRVGITLIEVMPLADFSGGFGWGYDGVDLYAPTRLYGAPDDLRGFVNRAHETGLGVILDVVYNHLGPDGNYVSQFADSYFNRERPTEWGDAINYDGENSGPVREFFIHNAGYWIEEFHFDGLRLDATQSVFDDSATHVLAEITARVRAAARGRDTIVVAENEPQHIRLVRARERGGYGMDGLWNDDFHHSATVALTGRNEAYYTDYRGSPQEFISAAKYGYLYQGQWYGWQKQRRGMAGLDVPPFAFVNYIQNHDQVANSARGERVHLIASAGRMRAMTALLLLAPGTPMLFQGQEFAASAPFLYFADHNPELADLVCKGRNEFLTQFPSLATPEMQAQLPDPCAFETFERCKLDFAERERHAAAYALHQDLLRLRREDGAFRAQRPRGVDGAVLGEAAFVLRFFGEDAAGGESDRLLLVNLGLDLCLAPGPEPLLAPPDSMQWRIGWSSEDPRYGGSGTPAVEAADNWRIPGESAIVLAPAPRDPNDPVNWSTQERKEKQKSSAEEQRERKA